MRRLALAVFGFPLALGAQQPGSPTALLNRMTGHWVMRGTIAKQETVHDVDVQWVLRREYVQIHEVSRDRDSTGAPKYEAIIYLEWDAKKGEYAVLWLDNTAQYAFGSGYIGRGKPAPGRIALIFPDPNGNDHTTFAYDPAKDTWTWTIDTEKKDGTLAPFARTVLSRK
ncbi:MAG TPA: hypothetical protein VG916_12845 [Gemmatimonadaceae bacterium]|nr:hypothetical protein [Gemmatimonadaceae bacterium]